MTDTTYNYVETDGAPLKMWTRGVPVEDVHELLAVVCVKG